MCVLSNRGKNVGRVVSNTDGEAGVWTEAGETFDTRKIEPQPRSPDLHSEPRFAVRFRAEWTVTGSRVGAAINLAGDGKLFVDVKDSRESVRHHVVLSKQLGRRSENRDAEIAERIEASVTSELLADENRSERVCLIEPDAARLV